MSSSSSFSGMSFRQTMALTAVVASLATTTAILSYQAIRREAATERLKRQVGKDVDEWEREHAGDSGSSSPAQDAESWSVGEKKPREFAKGQFDESLIREQLTRNYNFLGEEAMAKVRGAHVVVVGCGGVGSWCALMLLRSGVAKLTLIDFDLTTLSSLNRHACATLEDVGTPKVIAMQKYFRKVAPWAEVDAKVALWRKGEGEPWLEGADYVVDAIDNIDTKIELLTHCYKNNIKVFASMGAGAKDDPTRIQISDVSMTYEDPLARSVRTKLRKNGITGGIPVVYSTEVPGEVKLMPLPEDEFKKGSVKELGAFDDFRVRILPVLGPLPAIFGLHAATYIVLDLAGKPLDPCPIRHRKKLYQSLDRDIGVREARAFGTTGQPETSPIGVDDFAWIFEDVHGGRTTLPNEVVVHKPIAIRWDRSLPCTSDNLVILTSKDADKHEKEHLIGGKDLVELWGQDAVDIAARRNAEARRYVIYRRG